MFETPGDPAQTPRPPPDDRSASFPQAVIRHRAGISPIWLIPLLAVAIGLWLAVKRVAEQGPTIRIEFKTASGLAAGQTKVKFKDVDVGQVTAVDVSADLKTAIVTAELKQVFANFLTENTRFWVERPRVTASGISGLNTLLSGAFIALDPITDGQPRRVFQGLEEPPLFTAAEPGKRFVLRAPTLGSLNIGSPVHYRQIPVGQVAGYALDPDGQAVNIEIFISSPHDALVSANTRFWNVSGVDFSLSSGGIKIDTLSLLSVLIGGVSFDTPERIPPLRKTDAPASMPDHFALFASRAEAEAKTYSRTARYLLFFNGSVRGLASGAPVLLKGIAIGRVLDIQLQFHVADAQFQIPVLIEIEPDRIAVQDDSEAWDKNAWDRNAWDGTQMIERLVASGLRGQLKPGSLLTGELYVDLDVYPDARPATVVRHGDYDAIPTQPAPLEALTTQLAKMLDKLDRFPLERIGQDLSQTAAGANALVNAPSLKQALVELETALAGIGAIAGQINDRIAPELATTLQQTSATLRSANALVSENSSLSIDARRMFQEIATAARSVRLMADYLERHPEALLKGKTR